MSWLNYMNPCIEKEIRKVSHDYNSEKSYRSVKKNQTWRLTTHHTSRCLCDLSCAGHSLRSGHWGHLKVRRERWPNLCGAGVRPNLISSKPYHYVIFPKWMCPVLSYNYNLYLAEAHQYESRLINELMTQVCFAPLPPILFFLVCLFV